MLDLESKIKELVFVAQRAFTEKTRPELKKVSIEVLQDADAPAICLVIACRHVLGHDFIEWEPESIWLALDAELGDDKIPLLNRDKIIAATTLFLVPAFYWDYRVFGNTCLALNDHKPFAEVVPAPSPEHVAWAVFEAELMFVLHDEGKTEPEYDDEIAAYVGAILAHNGFVACPEVIKFAQPHLEKLLQPHAKDMAAKVNAAWARSTEKSELKEDELGVQLSRLLGVNLYVNNRADEVIKALSKF